MPTNESVTFVRNAFHSPDDPRHFMQIVEAPNRFVATVGGRAIATTDTALVVREVGFDVADPVVYFPRSDVDMEVLDPTGGTGHCPLKGDYELFDVGDGGDTATNGAWLYVSTIAAAQLKDMIGFDASQVDITTPPSAP